MNRTIAAGIVLLAAAPALAQDDASANWNKVVACAQDRSEKRRHECIDRVLAESGVLNSEKRVETLRQDERRSFGLSPVQKELAARKAEAASAAPGPQPAPAAPPVAAVAAHPARAPATPAAPPEAEKLDTLATEVSKAFDPGNRLMVFVTTDGQVWQQSERKDIGLPPKAGTAFTVERAAMGGFICKVGNSRSFRCRRQG